MTERRDSAPALGREPKMSKANEYKIYANECLAWAKTADTEEQRKQFLDLARTWMLPLLFKFGTPHS